MGEWGDNVGNVDDNVDDDDFDNDDVEEEDGDDDDVATMALKMSMLRELR